ncbi:glycosyltransferase [Candidatus Pristimantibacillus sp. PTI5]|uniref:glycosyltransferase n=1 Tax=Candidatus Pristimantibacillus sp. PTI5 TaxID=3400422 RepID=UPI003B0299D5
MINVSVVLPMYNVEKYLLSCLDSILNQSFKNFEVILVNDGSPDKCGEIADEYAKKDTRIKVIHKKNGGISSARNAGIDASTGEYIVFIDSDDKISEEYLLQLYATALNDNCDAVVCGYQKVPVNQHVIPSFKLKTIMNGKDFVLSSTNVHSNNDLCFTWRYLFNLNLIKQKQIRFNEKVSVGEDVIFNLEFLLESERVCAISKCLYYYTVDNPNSIMRSPYKAKLESSLTLQYNIKKQLSVKYGLLKNMSYRKDLADYYLKTIYRMMKKNLHNSPDADKLLGLYRIINNEMFLDSLKEIGLWYKCGNYKEYLYFLALKFKIFTILKREFLNTKSI